MKLKFIVLRSVHPGAAYKNSRYATIPHTLRRDLKTNVNHEDYYNYIAFLSPKASKMYVKQKKPVWIPYEVKKL